MGIGDRGRSDLFEEFWIKGRENLEGIVESQEVFIKSGRITEKQKEKKLKREGNFV